jgi:hypothetical protein
MPPRWERKGAGPQRCDEQLRRGARGGIRNVSGAVGAESSLGPIVQMETFALSVLSPRGERFGARLQRQFVWRK